LAAGEWKEQPSARTTMLSKGLYNGVKRVKKMDVYDFLW
jgi:hypothetical protein